MVYKQFIKRPMDFVLSLITLVVLMSLLLLIAFLVRIELGSPILFLQKRPGFHEKIFYFYKFRTMSNKKDKDGNLLPDFARLTSFGKFLRSFSLDELPELLNIIKGDMSIVGPRPLLVQYLPLYNDRQRKRHLVRPGLTGLAQIKGRNAISWNEKFEFDIKYVNNVTFFHDVQIIITTVEKVFYRDSINSSEDVTMEFFKG